MRRKPKVKAPAWNESWWVTPSRNNTNKHNFYREYFDKPVKAPAYNYRFKYPANAFEKPGIVPLGKHEPIAYHKIPYTHHVNSQAVLDLRQPIDSKAFPGLREHFEKAVNWNSNVTA